MLPVRLVLVAAILGLGCRGAISSPGSFITDIKIADKALVVDHCVIEPVHTTAGSRIAAAFSKSSYELRAARCWQDKVELPAGISPKPEGAR